VSHADVDLWVVRGAGIGEPVAGERARAAAMASARAAARHLRTRAVLRAVLADRFGGAPADVEIDDAPGRAPRLPGHPGLHVGLSHSGDVVAVALSEDGPIGVDVESVAGHPRGVPPVALDGDKLAAAAGLAGPRLAAHTVWVAQEAALKGEGIGLVCALDTLELERCPGGLQVRIAGRGTWGVAVVTPTLDTVAAAAVPGLPPRVRLHRQLPLGRVGVA
jgi:phosphopantetheinyl transferase